MVVHRLRVTLLLPIAWCAIGLGQSRPVLAHAPNNVTGQVSNGLGFNLQASAQLASPANNTTYHDLMIGFSAPDTDTWIRITNTNQAQAGVTYDYEFKLTDSDGFSSTASASSQNRTLAAAGDPGGLDVWQWGPSMQQFHSPSVTGGHQGKSHAKVVSNGQTASTEHSHSWTFDP